HAAGAFLHDAAAAYRHFWIASQPQDFGVEIRVGQEIEAPHLVRAVVGTVARADAAVIDHIVEAVTAVHGGRYRADELAGCVFAVHARHRLHVSLQRLGPLWIAPVIAVQAQPVHFAAAPHFGL